MRRVRSAMWWAAPSLCAGVLAVPALASSPGGGAVAPPPASAPQPGPVTAGALTVAPSSLLVGQTAQLSGALPADADASTLALQLRRGAKRWVTVAGGLAAADGTFKLAWRATTSGLLTLRVVSTPASGNAVAAATSAIATPDATLSVYAQVVVT